MHNILLFTLLPHLSHAFYPYNNDQAPLIDSPADITLPLQASPSHHLTYQNRTTHKTTRLSLSSLAPPIRSHSLTTLDIPLSQPASLTFSTSPEHQHTTLFQPARLWIPLSVSRPQLPLSYAAVRKGGTISLPAHSVQISLDTAYITLPRVLFSVIELATQPQSAQPRESVDKTVNCKDMGRFPDLVFGVDLGGSSESEYQLHREEDETGSQADVDDQIVEMIVSPEQYIRRLRNHQGEERCVLLVRAGEERKGKEEEEEEEEEEEGEEGIVLGWAGIRGKKVVVDWKEKVIGLEL